MMEDINHFKKRIAAASGLTEDEINKRWDEFISNAVTEGITPEEEAELRQEYRRRLKAI